MNFQPVVPIKLNDEWNLISRTILPIIHQNNVTIAATSQRGLGDTVQSFFFSPAKSDPFIWGFGPALLIPTGTDDRYSRRALLPIRLRYINPPHRKGSIGSTFQLLRQFVQPSLYPIRLDVLERLIVHSCRSAIGFRASAGKCQNILPVHLVVQRIETKVRRFLRLAV